MTRDELNALAATWPECDMWDCCEDAERLSHTTPLEALEAAIGDMRSEAELRDWVADGWKVYGWTRKAVTDHDIDAMVEQLTETFHEYWNDSLELGDPEQDQPPLIYGLRELITEDMRKREVWACERTHTIELTAEQVVAIARLECPDLFTEAAQ